ncbi:protein ABHD11 [Trichonephila inaurata madagascariensis]|uniref:Protein ABHD11 n=1 Tax=Trichonephila inaurata madagascariensis TaxID=2747483 RepID=A0A8X6I7J9_9ARAC|nr:protein ABHD11 [Trichonephila inaurata madagascariensis]
MRLAYDVCLPPGDKEENLPPVIFLHGMMDSRKTWKYIAPAVAKSTGRKHNIRKALYIGHSMGGRTALTLALTHV